MQMQARQRRRPVCMVTDKPGHPIVRGHRHIIPGIPGLVLAECYHDTPLESGVCLCEDGPSCPDPLCSMAGTSLPNPLLEAM